MNEFEFIVADVTTVDPFAFLETPVFTDSPTDESVTEDVEQDFAFDLLEPAVEEPVATLTEFDHEVMAAVLAGDFDMFAPAYLNEDGTSNFDLWSEANRMQNDLINNGVAPDQFGATMAEWLLA